MHYPKERRSEEYASSVGESGWYGCRDWMPLIVYKERSKKVLTDHSGYARGAISIVGNCMHRARKCLLKSQQRLSQEDLRSRRAGLKNRFLQYIDQKE